MKQFKPGETIQVGNVEVTILKRYPPGHRNAQLNTAFYLVDIPGEDRDTWREDILNQFANEHNRVV